MINNSKDSINGETEGQVIEALNLSRWIPKTNIFISGEVGYAKAQKVLFDEATSYRELEEIIRGIF